MPVKSSWPNVPIPEMAFHDILMRFIWSHGNNTALIDPSRNTSISFRDLYCTAYSLSTALHNLGLRKGDVVLISAKNCVEFPVILLAVSLRGAVLSGINPGATQAELKRQVVDSGCKFAFADAGSIGVLKRVLTGGVPAGKIKTIEITQNESSNVADATVANLLKTPPDFSLPRVPINPKVDLFLLPFSSGTTGHPKGVMLTHYNFCAMIVTAVAVTGDIAKFVDASNASSVSLGINPFYHVAGLAHMLGSLVRGTALLPMGKFSLETMLQYIQTHRIHTIGVAPPVVAYLTKSLIVNRYDLSSLRVVTCGAAPLGKELSEDFLARFPHVNCLLQGYGMTEMTLLSHFTPAVAKDQLRLGSIGKVIPNVESKIIDVETGRELGMNEHGEICVRSALVMQGYLNRADQTKQTVDNEKWLHTGDIGYYDEDGYFYVVDRLKELIKVRGFQVPPAELEDLLMSHESVQDAAVIGIPNQTAGEIPKAFVVLQPNATATEASLQSFIADQVAPYKQLNGGVEFVKEIPKSPSGKILRRQLKLLGAKSQAKL